MPLGTFIKVLMVYSNKWGNAFSFMGRRFGLAVPPFCKIGCLTFLKFDEWRRNCLADSITLMQWQIGFRESRKLWRNLCSPKWLKQRAV